MLVMEISYLVFGDGGLEGRLHGREVLGDLSRLELRFLVGWRALDSEHVLGS